MNSKAPALLFGFLVALAGLVLYLRTLAPTVLYYSPESFPDSVRLQVRAYVLGIPNPTGYPTYMMLSHLFTYLPFGDVAYRVNLFSAVCAAAAVLLVYSVALLLTGRIAASAGAALLFAVSRELWSQAVIAEVYTLHALLVASVLFVLFLWRERRRDGYLLLAAFLLGLSMTNHMTSGLLVPAAALFVGLVEWRRLVNVRLLLKGAGLFVLGLLPYAYLPIRSSMNPPLDEAEPSTLDGFVTLVTGAGFGSRMFAFGPAEVPGRLALYAGDLVEQFSPVFLVAAAGGVVCLALKDRAALALLGFLYLGWFVYAIQYNILDVRVYFIPTYLILCLFAAVGFAVLLEWVGRAARRLPPLPERAGLYGPSVLLAVSPLFGAGAVYEEVDRSEELRGRETLEAVESTVEPGATILHRGSELLYMRYVEDGRPDVEFVDPFPPGEWSRETEVWAEAAEESLADGPVYVIFPDGGVLLNLRFFTEAGYDLSPVGEGGLLRVEER